SPRTGEFCAATMAGSTSRRQMTASLPGYPPAVRTVVNRAPIPRPSRHPRGIRYAPCHRNFGNLAYGTVAMSGWRHSFEPTVGTLIQHAVSEAQEVLTPDSAPRSVRLASQSTYWQSMATVLNGMLIGQGKPAGRCGPGERLARLRVRLERFESYQSVRGFLCLCRENGSPSLWARFFWSFQAAEAPSRPHPFPIYVSVFSA